MPNRIAEHRKRKGWSQAELARHVGTSQPQIDRLEKGERRLTEDWMKRLAKVLQVRPADLLEAATLAEFENDVEPHLIEASEDLARPLASRKLAYWRIIGRPLERVGLGPGKIILVDSSAQAIKSRKSGDVLLIEVKARGNRGPTLRILRQFLAPTLVTTNHSGTNTSFTLDERYAFEARILGVVATP